MVEKETTTLLFHYALTGKRPVVSIKNSGKYLSNTLDKLCIFDESGILIDFNLNQELDYDIIDVIKDKFNPKKPMSTNIFEIKLNACIELKEKRIVDFTNIKKIKEKVFGCFSKPKVYCLYIHKDLINFSFEKSQCNVSCYHTCLNTQSYYKINDNLTIIKSQEFLDFDDFYSNIRNDVDAELKKIQHLFFYDDIDASPIKMDIEFKAIKKMFKETRKSHSKTLQLICDNWDSTKSATENMQKYLE